RTAPRSRPTPVPPAAPKPGARGLVYLLWLVVVVETGLLGGIWLRSGGWPLASRPLGPSRAGGRPNAQAVPTPPPPPPPPPRPSGPAPAPRLSQHDDGSAQPRRGERAANRAAAGQHAGAPGGLRP